MSSLSDNNLILLWNRMKTYINNRLENLGLDHLHTLGQVATKDVVPIENGGTNANTVSNARQNINYIGVNPISSVEDDTSENWRLLGTGIAGYNTTGLITDQPSKYGILENQVFGATIFQIWHETASNSNWYRRGNQNGWQSSWIKMLDEGNGISIKKLWDNASPSSAFTAQTVSLNLSDYDFIDIDVKLANSRYQVQRFKVGQAGFISSGNEVVTATNVNYTRLINVTTSGVSFEGGYFNSAQNDNYVIPEQIYGIKGVL